MRIPYPYDWLHDEPAPRHLLEAIKLYGTEEIIGPRHNPIILDWAADLGLSRVFLADETAWCGLLTGIVIQRAGREPVKDPLWARNWLHFGIGVEIPKLADILVFRRSGGGGHVGLYIGEDDRAYHVYGGNQGNRVGITRILKNRLLGARRPAYINQPENIRQIQLTSIGKISTNEA